MCEKIEDAPLARLREIQKRMRAEQQSEASTAPTSAVEKKPRGMMMSMDEMRALRDS